MATHLDLEEQEQLDQLKHFWKQYGNLITWILIVAMAGYASWNFYNYWERKQSAQAAALYDEVARAAGAGDTAKLERAFGDMKDKFGSTAFAGQAGLVTGKVMFEKGNADAAKAALTWVSEKASDDGYKAVARLRLAGVLIQSKAYDEAAKVLAESVPAQYAPLVADRQGDLLSAQGKTAEAVAAYKKAYEGMQDTDDYRRLVEVKLNALGVDPRVPVVSVEVKK
ncbi:YfgM family protein [Variovorax sp. HJSM1_2]|uniref:YfgM family protein n=1 Tax=Variovorax sp. HJSM1_2 TaxID=3366263 RepID=UPI003BBC17DF